MIPDYIVIILSWVLLILTVIIFIIDIIIMCVVNKKLKAFNKLYKEKEQYKHKFILVNDNLIDLTAMFGKGNELKTKEEIESLFPKRYYEYEEGEK